MIFAKKLRTLPWTKVSLTAEVYSLYQASDQHRFYRWKIPSPEDKVLIIDDFLANGQAAKGLIQIIEQAGATVEAIGIVIENLSKMAVICLKKRATLFYHSLV